MSVAPVFQTWHAEVSPELFLYPILDDVARVRTPVESADPHCWVCAVRGTGYEGRPGWYRCDPCQVTWGPTPKGSRPAEFYLGLFRGQWVQEPYLDHAVVHAPSPA
jgi:hypothetical protein